MGGCAPYFSSIGMFTSSTNRSIFVPGGAPSRFLRLRSNRFSRKSTMFAEDVCAEKLALATANDSPALFRNCWMPTDLPTPVSPVNKVLKPPCIRLSKSNRCNVVSTVGTNMLKNGTPATNSNAGTASVIGTKALLSWSTQTLYRSALCGVSGQNFSTLPRRKSWNFWRELSCRLPPSDQTAQKTQYMRLNATSCLSFCAPAPSAAPSGGKPYRELTKHSSILRNDVTRLESVDGIPGASLHSSRMNGSAASQMSRHHLRRVSA
mmetsp:Transcript_29968/g.85668  ORF Transcript_29968/g.85668 Transcript_29968/m.85668 type:complete len:264 (-) Transcript_29968:28-819(-)